MDYTRFLLLHFHENFRKQIFNDNNNNNMLRLFFKTEVSWDSVLYAESSCEKFGVI